MPRSWRLEITSSAARSLARLPEAEAKRIDRRILDLATDPRPRDARKLGGKLAGLFRVRCGRYRAIYEVLDETRTVRILHVAQRKNVYRG